MESFFLKRPVLESTAARTNTTPARVQKSSAEIKEAWQVILDRRRLVQPDDTLPIHDRDILADLYTTWMHEWLKDNLTPQQQRLKFKQKSSNFAAEGYSAPSCILTGMR